MDAKQRDGTSRENRREFQLQPRHVLQTFQIPTAEGTPQGKTVRLAWPRLESQHRGHELIEKSFGKVRSSANRRGADSKDHWRANLVPENGIHSSIFGGTPFRFFCGSETGTMINQLTPDASQAEPIRRRLLATASEPGNQGEDGLRPGLGASNQP